MQIQIIDDPAQQRKGPSRRKEMAAARLTFRGSRFWLSETFSAFGSRLLFPEESPHWSVWVMMRANTDCLALADDRNKATGRDRDIAIRPRNCASLSKNQRLLDWISRIAIDATQFNPGVLLSADDVAIAPPHHRHSHR
jgi:hypothetical protein